MTSPHVLPRAPSFRACLGKGKAQQVSTRPYATDLYLADEIPQPLVAGSIFPFPFR